MKLQIILNSDHFSEKQNEITKNNPISLDWDFPFLPRIGETFYTENTIATPENLDYDVHELNWTVFNLSWGKNIDREIFLEIDLTGE